METEKEEKDLPENVTLICACGRVIATAKGMTAEEGFTCFCGLPIEDPSLL